MEVWSVAMRFGCGGFGCFCFQTHTAYCVKEGAFSSFTTPPVIPVRPCREQVEDDYVELAKNLMEKAEAKGVKFLLPEDVVVADKASKSAATPGNGSSIHLVYILQPVAKHSTRETDRVEFHGLCIFKEDRSMVLSITFARAAAIDKSIFVAFVFLLQRFRPRASRQKAALKPPLKTAATFLGTLVGITVGCVLSVGIGVKLCVRDVRGLVKCSFGGCCVHNWGNRSPFSTCHVRGHIVLTSRSLADESGGGLLRRWPRRTIAKRTLVRGGNLFVLWVASAAVAAASTATAPASAAPAASTAA